MSRESLVTQAITARNNAYVPYSHFKVGAAVQTEDGTVYTGANIENASYGLTMCAERNAIFAAVCAGARKIAAIAVVADTDDGVSPCGACRQVMTEFTQPNTPVYLGNLHDTIEDTTVGELLPGAFNKEDMHNA
ncbi:cytidine deaminase [Lacticaseibacillus pabuli]|uniref:Cytidine deaminase n=1 Tax=Lacticaseibacillus pabuli TaxID=3025672 RepID=A0ABY7WUF5_9LACO|nr:cytidine deaminase [Lacticaseibacillus sp. KACC 23028]WDF83788.1 cytidine deaminase [Lacticaseibacillus sp. KACC 23028]